MKSAKVKEARAVLKKKAKIVRVSDGHEIWQRANKDTFALPISHRIVSPGVMRQVHKFVKGIDIRLCK